jgi:deoxyadenosine/deoxycytidine kinase
MGPLPLLDAPVYRSNLVYIAGNLCSGKSTLAQALSLEAGWELLPEPSKPLDYLPDLFDDPHRWALETQVAFLASKAETVRATRDNHPASFSVIDRSIYEHYEVFVRAFHEMGAIDGRGLAMFARLHTQMIEGLPQPSAIILCDAAADVCEDRMRARGRALDRLYPEGHVARLGRHLSRWASSFTDAPVLVFDSVGNDPRDIDTARRIRRDIERVVLVGDTATECLGLIT